MEAGRRALNAPNYKKAKPCGPTEFVADTRRRNFTVHKDHHYFFIYTVNLAFSVCAFATSRTVG